MTHKPGGTPGAHGAEAAFSPDDPWSPVTGETLAELRGTPPPKPAPPPREPGVIEVEHPETDAARTGVSTEMVDLLADSIAQSPERADLWMMRFELLRGMGMKPEFLEAALDAWRKPRVRRLLDWNAIVQQWTALSPEAPLPDEITEVLKHSAAVPHARSGSLSVPSAAIQAAAPGARPTNRRFADLALQAAPAELDALSRAYSTLRSSPGFYTACARHLATILKRPTPLQRADVLAAALGCGGRLYLKREDLLKQTPETANAAAHAYLARALEKTGLVTGNDVDAHSLALAEIARQSGLSLRVFVDAEDYQRKPELLDRLRALGAQVQASEAGVSDPRESALLYWKSRAADLHLALSLGAGPRPYPTIVSDFKSLLGRETVLQARALTGMARPWTFIASVYSEADSIGFMIPHLPIQDILLYYAEPDRTSSERPDTRGRAYNGHRREHAWLKASGRIGYGYIPDAQAREMQEQAQRLEKISVGFEDARALVEVSRLARAATQVRDLIVLVA